MNVVPDSYLKVLIVEDSPLVASRIKSLLGELSEVQLVGEAVNSKEALIIIHVMAPDVVLLDISIPGKSGIHLLKEIKKDYSDTKVIMMTMYGEPYYKDICMELGADYFFDKSTEFEKVPEALTSLFQIKIKKTVPEHS